jgi:hypothetical protein
MNPSHKESMFFRDESLVGVRTIDSAGGQAVKALVAWVGGEDKSQ